MNDQLLFGVAVVPAIIGLTQVGKEIGIPSRFAPLIAVLFGILAALAQVYAGQWQWIPAAVLGVSLGLSAVGLYSSTVTFQRGTRANGSPPRPDPNPAAAQPAGDSTKPIGVAAINADMAKVFGPGASPAGVAADVGTATQASGGVPASLSSPPPPETPIPVSSSGVPLH